MAKLTALQPINHDGKEYAEGDTLSVTDDAQVAQLLDANAAVSTSIKSRAQKAAEAAEAAVAAAALADQAIAAEAAAAAGVVTSDLATDVATDVVGDPAQG
jgi:hypothetical protein